MGSKKILEEMFELVTKKSSESIEESKFNESILSSIKLKSSKEIDAVLTELLLTLREGKESIGEISNGKFVCYTDVVQQAEEIVMQRFETKELYVEKKNNDIEIDENKDGIEDKSKEEREIERLLDRYNDLNDEEYERLLNNLGELDDSEMETLIEHYRGNQSSLVESGVKEQSEVEDDVIMHRLKRALEREDYQSKKIATLALIIKSDNVDLEVIESCKIALKNFLRENPLSLEAKKLCEETDIYSLTEGISEKTENAIENRHKKITNLENCAIEEIETWKKININDRKWANFAFQLKKGNDYITLESLEAMGLSRDFTKKTVAEQEMIMKTTRRQQTFQIKEDSRRKFQSRSQTSKEETKGNEKQDGDSTKKRVIKPSKRSSKKLKPVRYASQLGGTSNARKIRNIFNSNNITTEMYIKDNEMEKYYFENAASINIGNFDHVVENHKKAPRRSPVAAEMIVEQVQRWSSDNMERMKRLIAIRGSKDKRDEAYGLLFELATDKENPKPNANDRKGSTTDSKTNERKTEESFNDGEIA